MKTLAPLLGLLLMAACAAGENRVTDSDRALSDQNAKGAQLLTKQLSDVAVQLSTVPGLPGSVTATLAAGVLIAKTIQANADQQLVNWGGKEKVPDPKPFSPKESEDRRKQSDDEHASIKWWHGVAAAGLAGLGWVARNVGLGSIPYIGPFLARYAPSLAVGASAEKKINAGLQVAVDEGRAGLDALLPRIKDLLKERLPDGADALIDQLEIPDLKDIVVKELQRRGVLAQNTILYDANPDTGDVSKT